jgi:hypothetical protein
VLEARRVTENGASLIKLTRRKLEDMQHAQNRRTILQGGAVMNERSEDIMAKERLDTEGLVEVPVSQLTRFLKFIATNDLWDELEQHLTDRGCYKLLMSFEPVKLIGSIVQNKSSELARKNTDVAKAQPSGDRTTIRCGCNGPMGPRPGPVTPGGGGTDGGADGGLPQ